MTIGIIGSGNVGGALGTAWSQAGHDVIFSSRNPQSKEVQELALKAGPKARAASVAEAAEADVVLFATPWPLTEKAVRSAGKLQDKVVIDATNPLREDLSGLEIGTTTSGGEQVAEWAKGAKVVKAFNTIGYKVMADARFQGDRSVLFYCGDDPQAKETVRGLASDIGFEPIDAGPLVQARTLEPLALLWISLAIKQGLGFEFAYKLLRR
jgi:8-hydroxy-5-deazaflavin:NADPH oxidoreductase